MISIVNNPLELSSSNVKSIGPSSEIVPPIQVAIPQLELETANPISNESNEIVFSFLYSKADRKSSVCLAEISTEQINIIDKEPEILDITDVSDYFSIRKKCVAEKRLYEDTNFSPEIALPDASEDIIWLRPRQIASNPYFLSDGQSRFDIVQGELGDCWFLAAMASFTLSEELFTRVVPPDQNFVNDYAGIFRFFFHREGEWQEVIVDDRLPTRDGQLIFIHSKDSQEFWCALLEKAYAKFCGSYRVLNGGFGYEALSDMSGGITEQFLVSIKNQEVRLIDVIIQSLRNKSLLSCAKVPHYKIKNEEEIIDEVKGQNTTEKGWLDILWDYLPAFMCVVPPQSQIEPKKDEAQNTEQEIVDGIVMSHAYSITGIAKIKVQNSSTILLRLRNPWSEMEWDKSWSDESQCWELVDKEVRELLNKPDANDGEFWISYLDFLQNFNYMDICHLGLDQMLHSHFPAISKLHKCIQKSFLHRFHDFDENIGLYVKDVEFKLCDKNENYIINITMSQKCYRSSGSTVGFMGFKIYQKCDTAPIKEESKCIASSENCFRQDDNIIFIGFFRELSKCVEIPPGEYVIHLNAERPIDFVLKIYCAIPNLINGDD